MSFFAFGYALPMFIITVLYVLIAWHLASHKPTTTNQSRSRERNARTLRVIILVVLVFGISWLPTHAQAITSYFVPLPSGAVYQVGYFVPLPSGADYQVGYFVPLPSGAVYQVG